MKMTQTSKKTFAFIIAILTFSLGCQKRVDSPELGQRTVERQESTAVDLPDEASGLVNLARAQKLLSAGSLDDLLNVFEPGQIPRLTEHERKTLAEIFFRAAKKIRYQRKEVSYSSLFCERGLMLQAEHLPLLRLQIRNYLHADMELVSGAEELAVALVKISPRSQENQFLRGRVAMEQGEYDVAIGWLKKAARAGLDHEDKLVNKAWAMLGRAEAQQKEIDSALSMTQKLEAMMVDVRKKPKKRTSRRYRDSPRLGSDPAVVLYMASWCGYCGKARDLLKSLRVPFVEKNIEKDPEALQQMMALAEMKGVAVTGIPVVRVGNDLVVGYNRLRIVQLIKQQNP